MHRRTLLSGALSAGALAAATASLAGCAGYSRRDILAQWPPIGRIIEVDGLPVHYWERGTGQPVVLVHGASGNLRDWTFDAAPRLAQRYRVIAFDRPGFGYSARLPSRGWDPEAQAAHLHAATRLIDVENPVIVGHSWGGALAMAWGLRHPQALRGIVSLAGATMPFDGGVGRLNEAAASPLGPLVGRAVSALAGRDLVASRIQAVFDPQPVPPGYLDYLGWPLATRAESVVWNARDLDNLSAQLAEQSRRYPSLAVPVEILHGTADDVVWPTLHAVPMDALLPDSRLTLIDGMGHMPHHFAHQALAAAIDRLAAR